LPSVIICIEPTGLISRRMHRNRSPPLRYLHLVVIKR
jgi:hypothetical protein